jgi:hypothetical protein
VLLGWGSLAHVLDDEERRRLLRALTRLCPRGPLLASFFCEYGGDGDRTQGRAERLGAACGRRLATLRNVRVAPSPRERFTLHAGFARMYSRAEIEALVEAVGRKVVWEEDETDYPHATFL